MKEGKGQTVLVSFNESKNYKALFERWHFAMSSWISRRPFQDSPRVQILQHSLTLLCIIARWYQKICKDKQLVISELLLMLLPVIMVSSPEIWQCFFYCHLWRKTERDLGNEFKTTINCLVLKTVIQLCKCKYIIQNFVQMF